MDASANKQEEQQVHTLNTNNCDEMATSRNSPTTSRSEHRSMNADDSTQRTFSHTQVIEEVEAGEGLIEGHDLSIEDDSEELSEQGQTADQVNSMRHRAIAYIMDTIEKMARFTKREKEAATSKETKQDELDEIPSELRRESVESVDLLHFQEQLETLSDNNVTQDNLLNRDETSHLDILNRDESANLHLLNRDESSNLDGPTNIFLDPNYIIQEPAYSPKQELHSSFQKAVDFLRQGASFLHLPGRKDLKSTVESFSMVDLSEHFRSGNLSHDFQSGNLDDPDFISTVDEKNSSFQNATQTIKNTAINVKQRLEGIYDRVRRNNKDDDNKQTPKRKSTRLKSHPYSKETPIFVTEASKDFHSKSKTDKTRPKELSGSSYPIIGAAIVCFPYALKQAGFPLGLILMFLIAVVLDYSELLLQQCSKITKKSTMQEMVSTVFHRPGWVASQALVILYSISVLLTYNVILGDCLTKVVNASLREIGSVTVMHRRVIVTLVTLIIIFPISLMSNKRTLAWWTLTSVISGTLVSVLVCTKLFTLSPNVPDTAHAFKFLNFNLLQSIGIITFAFSCQHRVRLSFTMVNRNQNKSQKPSTTEAGLVSSYSMLCTFAVAICGYLTFKGVTQGDLMENYCEEDLFTAITRTIFALLTTFLYPMECQTVRNLFSPFVNSKNKHVEVIFEILVTFVTIFPAFGVSLGIDCLPFVLEISGLLFAIPLVFIIPTACFVQLSKGPMYSAKKLPCLILISLGSIISICGVIIALFTNHQCIHNTRLFPYCDGSGELLGPLITLMTLNETDNFDPRALGFNQSDFEDEFMNITDLANAYFT